MDKLSKEIDTMLDEFGCEKDERIANISDEDFLKSIEEAEKKLKEEFQEIDEKRARAFQQAINEGIILI